MSVYAECQIMSTFGLAGVSQDNLTHKGILELFVGYSHTNSWFEGCIIPFKTPNVNSIMSNMKLEVGVKGGTNSIEDSHTVRYAISTSSNFLNSYIVANSENVYDPYRLCIGTINIPFYTSTTIENFTLNISGLQPNQLYYLVLWHGETIDLDNNNYIKNTKLEIETRCALKVEASSNPTCYIDEGNKNSPYICTISDGRDWLIYKPYVTIKRYEDWEGLFEATVTATDGLNLRGGLNTGTAVQIILPYKAEIAVTDIDIGTSSSGQSVWVYTTYSNKSGWCNSSYLNFKIYGKISKELGVNLYENPSSDSYIQEVLDKGTEFFSREIEIYGNPLIVNEEIIWIHVYINHGDENNSSGYLKLDEVEILSERTSLEWVELSE